MKTRLICRMVASLLCCWISCVHAGVQYRWNDFEMTANGFLTLGGSTLIQDKTFAYNSTAGYKPLKNSLDLGWPTTLGGQVTIAWDNQIGTVVQAVTTGRRDWKVDFEMAYLFWRPLQGLELRAGNIISPFLMLSQIRHVSYAYPWPLPLFDIYGLGTQTRGLDLTWNHPIGSWDMVINPYFTEDTGNGYGEQRGVQAHLFKGDSIELWGLMSQSRAIGSGKAMAVPIDYTVGLLAPFLGLDANQAADFASELKADPYFAKDMVMHRWAIGARYETQELLGMFHYARHNLERYSDSFVCWFVVGGWYINPKLMPYFEYGFTSARGKIAPYVAANPAGYSKIFESVINDLMMVGQNALDLEVSALGIRYSFLKNTDLKFEWRRFNPKGGTRNLMTMENDQDYVDMLTFAVNMVF